ncbi:PREDICTED: uncharacterized protein LOC109147395 [Ipomoea nil]|uniref:uncharacterized protein LOC109147395 n=1 Tax=Ipomoea nil TaxID=35883 RepID=UPI000900CB40|nr:PREDICTED: uncharacterized protein LOC109147395 [Ipomoea nil]
MERKEMKYHKNDKVRCAVKCKHESCPWKVILRFNKDDKCWRLSVVKDKHDGCVRTQNNSMVNSSIVAKRWKQQIRGNLEWKTNSFLEKILTDDHYILSKKQAWRALVKEKVKVSDLKENGKERFLRMYICWEATREGFKHCRKIIGLDGCHLKCKIGGQLLTAVGIDANESLFPIAYAVVEDKQKGLIQACESTLQGVRHIFCVRHLHNNMRVAGFTANAIKDALWKAARATTVNNFSTALLELRKLDENAYVWLGDKDEIKDF